MRVRTGRASAVVVATIAAAVMLSVTDPSASAATAPTGLSAFREAVGQVESGGNYTARNPTSGAYGKYQIMPSNWPSWASTYLGNPSASWSPSNQDKVASGKMTALHHWLGSWKRVAYWWLTGSSQTTGWSTYATNYVNKVITLYKTAVAAASTSTAVVAVAQESNSTIAYSGTWKAATHTSYGGDRVLYATAAGASATFTFQGQRIVWIGPEGPTRGKAKVYIDGAYVKTVDTYASSFIGRGALFDQRFASPGEHTISIVVVGTVGRPVVALDEFRITR